MEKRNKTEKSDDQSDYLPVNAFSESELAICPKCARKNPPTKTECLYCGAVLSARPEMSGKTEISLNRPEIWENGFNLVFLPANDPIDTSGISLIGELTGLGIDHSRMILNSKIPLPILRADSPEDLKSLGGNLEKAGINWTIISDSELGPEKSFRRLRKIKFESGQIQLVLFNEEETLGIDPEEMVLLVAGKIFQKKVRATEKRLKAGERKILDSAETLSDEPLLDIFIKRDRTGFRVFTHGFDFSCLGHEKGFIARENLEKLFVRLRSAAPNAGVIENYGQLREFLDPVWEIEEKKEATGLKRAGIGKFNLEHLTIATNLNQFNKFSRLQFVLL